MAAGTPPADSSCAAPTDADVDASLARLRAPARRRRRGPRLGLFRARSACKVTVIRPWADDAEGGDGAGVDYYGGRGPVRIAPKGASVDLLLVQTRWHTGPLIKMFDPADLASVTLQTALGTDVVDALSAVAPIAGRLRKDFILRLPLGALAGPGPSYYSRDPRDDLAALSNEGLTIEQIPASF